MSNKRGNKGQLKETCYEYVEMLKKWPNVKGDVLKEAGWRTTLSAVINKCRERDKGATRGSIRDDCDPDELIGLASILDKLLKLSPMNSMRHDQGEGKDEDNNPSKKENKGGKRKGTKRKKNKRKQMKRKRTNKKRKQSKRNLRM